MKKIYNKFCNLKIASKLLISFILVSVIAVIVGIVGIYNIKDIQRLDEEMYTNHLETFDDLTKVIENYQISRANLRDLLILSDNNEKQKKIEELDNLENTINTHMTIFKNGILDERVRDNFGNLEKAMSDFFSYEDKIISMVNSNQTEQAKASLYSDGVQIATAANTATENLLNLKVEVAKQSVDKNKSSATVATILMIVVIIIGVIIAIILGIFISRLISNPINKMVEAADKLAVGDIGANVDITTRDEIGKLAKSFSAMIENIRGQALIAEKIADGDLTVDVPIKSENDLLGKKLSEMVEKNNDILRNISIASEQVASGSTQISDSSVSLSQGATEQASTVEELNASLEEISAQTMQNAENANQANNLATNSKLAAQQGNTQMKEMLKAMRDINASSNNISKIIKVIDDIAFQTNILALNAAVEAARAGQHGKGFAVVAEEVRNLAARSASAAKETTEMIEDSIIKVGEGTKIAEETANALIEMENGAEMVANIVNDIAVASKEQAIGIGQINQGIMQVSEVIQGNSATSEEVAAASEELSSQAVLLKDTVSQFNLKSYTSTNAN